MTTTQSRAITPYVMNLVLIEAQKIGHPPSRAAIGSVLQRLASCSNSEGVVDQSLRQLVDVLFISESVVKRVLAAATAAGVLVTIRKGGGVAKLPTKRQLRLDYHNDGGLYFFGEPARHKEPSSASNGDPSDPNTGPSAPNTGPLGTNTLNKYKELSPPSRPALSQLEADKAAEACEIILKNRREKCISTINNPHAWERTVRQDIESRYGNKIRSLIRAAPEAPVQLIASCAETGNSAVLAPYAADSVAAAQTD